MRILIAVHGYPPTFNGGAERRAERTARHLAARGHAVAVLCVEALVSPPAVPWVEDRIQDGVWVRRIGLVRPVSFRELYDHPQGEKEAARWIREWRPEIFHLFSGYLLTASVLRAALQQRVPIIISLTDYWWLCHRINLMRTDGSRCDGPSILECTRCYAEQRRRYRWPSRVFPPGARMFWRLAARIPALQSRVGFSEQEMRVRVLRDMLARADLLIAPSRFLAGIYLQHGAPADRLRVLRQGVEWTWCPLRKPSATLRVGYVGQVKYHKGVDLLLTAWGMLRGDRPRELRLYGSDRGEEAYGRWIRQQLRNLKHATWVGEFAGDRAAEIMSELDVLVIPSRWHENSPNVILEAQAVGVPVVGAALGGIPELIRHEWNGLLFQPDNPQDLACQLQRLLDEPDLLPQLRRRPLPFRSVEEEIEELEYLYESLRRGSILSSDALS